MRNLNLSLALRDSRPAEGPARRAAMHRPGDNCPTQRWDARRGALPCAPSGPVMGTDTPGFALLDWTISLPAPPDWHCSLCPMPDQNNGREPSAWSLSTPVAKALGARSWTIGWLSLSEAAGLEVNIRSSNTMASTLIA
jgi:hypothetical protein